MKNYFDTNQYALPSTIIGIALVLMAGVGGYAFYKVRTLDSLSVTGSAERIVKSDTVKWTMSISRNVSTSGLPQGSALMKRDIETVKSYLKNNKVTEKEITVAPMIIREQCTDPSKMYYGYNGEQSCGSSLAGYSLNETITVESLRVDEVTELSQKATDYFLTAGVVFTNKGIEYYYNKLADLRLELISEATKNAMDRAENIAKSTGARIGSIQSASTGVFQVTAKNSVDVSDYGSYDTQAVDKKVTAVVRATFSVR